MANVYGVRFHSEGRAGMVAFNCDPIPLIKCFHFMMKNCPLYRPAVRIIEEMKQHITKRKVTLEKRLIT